MSLLLAFAAALGPLMFQARHIFMQGHRELSAQVLLRSLLATSFDRRNPVTGWRDGESAGLNWRVDVEPFVVDANSENAAAATSGNGPRSNWALFRIRANVSWGAGQAVAAETIRLGHVE